MKSLNEDLSKQEFKQVYLLYGEESYLKKMYKNKLSKAIVAPGDTMNSNYFEGKSISVPELIDVGETLPFFADRRLLVVENSGFFKGQGAELADYMKELPETTYFLFVESEVDRRSKMFKAVKAIGRVVELGKQDEQTLIRWILGILKKEGKKITQGDMQLLLTKTGTDMENIEKEVEKLVCYSLDRDVITREDIEAVCTTQTTNKIFDMINAMAQKKQKKALQLYYDLLALKEPPMRILFLITRQFNLLMQVKDLAGLGFDQSTIGQKAGLHGFVVRNYISQARSFSKEKLKEAVEDCVAAEEAIKTGKIQDVISVELLLIKYSI
jgi:DNA polymerase-3 subunit delta